MRSDVSVDGLRLAVGTLTAVPVGPPARTDRSTARVAMLLAPVAVLPLGLAAAAVGAVGVAVSLPAPVVAVLLVGVVALGSRGLHLDGLADTADGLGSGYHRDRALDVMRRGNTGPMGVSTLLLVLLAQVAAAATVLSRPWGAVAIAVLVCLSRTALFLACAAGVPAARPNGLGAAVAGVVPRAAAGIGLLLAAGVAAFALVITGSRWWLGIVAVVVAAAVTAGLLARCVRRFGGITGDVLGAAIEIDLAALLVVASL